jgi:hypothetical protein
VVLLSCSTYWPTEAKKFKPEFAVECLLVQGQPIDSVWIRLSYDILEAQEPTQPLYDSAFIVVYTANDSDTLIAKDTLPNCFYSKDSLETVQCGETYYLYAAVYKKGIDTVIMRAQTTVPDSFSCIPLGAVWLKDTTKVKDILKMDYKELEFVDTSTGVPVPLYEPFFPNDTGYYLYNDSLRFFTFLICVFYDYTFPMGGTEFSLFNLLESTYGITPPVPPNNTAKGVMVEYEWGIGQGPWEDLEFVIGSFFGMMDSTGYFRHKHLVLGAFPNTKTDLANFFTNYALVQYVGNSAFNLYALDDAAYDWEVTKWSEVPESNVQGGAGVFGSASIFRILFYMQATKNLITNGEAMIIKERQEAEMENE